MKRIASRQGPPLRKCPVRDPHACAFGMFMLIREKNGLIVYVRDKTGTRIWAGTLDGVEAYLKREDR